MDEDEDYDQIKTRYFLDTSLLRFNMWATVLIGAMSTAIFLWHLFFPSDTNRVGEGISALSLWYIVYLHSELIRRREDDELERSLR